MRGLPEGSRKGHDGAVSVVWLNGELLDESRALISVLDRGVIWGYGLFETLRSYDGRVWAFEEHYDRLRSGAEVLELPVPAPEWMREGVDATLRANDLQEAGVRLTVTRGAGPPDPHSEPFEEPNVFVTAWPLAQRPELYEEGVALVTVPGGARPLAGVKTTSYAASVAGRMRARRFGGDDGLFVDEGGRVLEATGSNVLAVFEDLLITPPLEDGLLPGVTREALLQLAPGCGLEAREASLDVADLFRADEVLLTSTLREVYPARSVDGRDLQRGPMAGRLRAAFREMVDAVLSEAR